MDVKSSLVVMTYVSLIFHLAMTASENIITHSHFPTLELHKSL